ncbi:phage tail protein [candidate division KSB1 bacterium]|nr:phage tail protein [candidate division KSB1 bacterium]
MANARKNDPYRNFRFRLEIDSITQAGFSECSGFGSELDAIDYREGNEVTNVRKLSGLTKYSNVTLKWGITDNMDLYKWHKDAIAGKIQRKNGSVIGQDEEGNDTVRWNFKEAWPSKYDPPDFNAKGNEVAIETLELVCEGVERVS